MNETTGKGFETVIVSGKTLKLKFVEYEVVERLKEVKGLRLLNNCDVSPEHQGKRRTGE